MSGKSGLWESIVHEAQQRVIEYLCSSTHSFEVEAPLAQCMLSLIDTSLMIDIVHERNGNGYCGRIGCSNKLCNTACDETRLQRSSRSPEEWSSTESEEELELEEWKEQMQTKPKNTAVDANSKLEKKDKASKSLNILESNDDEIVYDDDWFTNESFKLAALQQKQLNKIRQQQQQQQQQQRQQQHAKQLECKQHQHEKEQESEWDHPCRARHKANSCHIARHCFCSVECAISYKNELIAKYVPRHVDYNHPELTSVIANLFPNMKLETLRQLSTVECNAIPGENCSTQAPHKVLSTHIEEKSITANNCAKNLKPIVIGVAYEDPTTLLQKDKDKKKEQEQSENDAMLQQSLKQMWSSMDVVQKIWDNETRKEHHGCTESETEQQKQSHQEMFTKETKNKIIVVKQDVNDDKDSVKEKENTKEVSKEQNKSSLNTHPEKEEEDEKEDILGNVAISSPNYINTSVKLLHGSLLIMDFVTNVTSELTNALAIYLFVCHKQQIMQIVERFNDICNTLSTSSSSSLQTIKEIVTTIVTELDRKTQCVCHATHNDNTDNLREEKEELEEAKQYLCTAWHKHHDYHVHASGLHVNSITQRQRREIFVNKSFMSISHSMSLSRLLRIDYDILVRLAWGTIWNTPLQSVSCNTIPPLPPCTLMESLHFLFAIPSAFLSPLTQSPEALGLALVWVVASSVLHPRLLQELLCIATMNSRHDNNDVWSNIQFIEIPVVQLMSIIHMTKEEMISAVRTLIIDCDS